MSPTHIGRYEILGELGRGGMGIVYRARRADLDREFALKVIRPGRDADPETIARFLREARAAARLASHPGIVGVHDVGDDGGTLYLAMDYVPGGTLEQLLDEERIEPRQVAGWLAQVARAVHFAHAHGILHRDVKPANILIETSNERRANGETSDAGHESPIAGRVKVTDFGLAAPLASDAQTERLTRSGMTVGTPGYMAPEQAVGQRVDARADVYALGATLYECLTGSPPFPGANAFDVLQRVVRDDPLAPRRRRPTVPKDLETVTLRCLEKEPDRRYPTAEALAVDLERFVAGEPVAARPISSFERWQRRIRRNPVPAAAIGVGVLALGVALWIVGVQQTAARAEIAQSIDRALAIADDAPAKALAMLEGMRERAPEAAGLEDAMAAVRKRALVHEREARQATARQLLDRAALARAELATHVANLAALEREAEPSVSSRRREHWARLDEAWGTIRTFHMAALELLADAGDAALRAEAAHALADVALQLATRAEREGEAERAARWLAVARANASERHAAVFAGDGTLTLDTAPSGATVIAEPYEDPDADGRLTLGAARTLGAAPLDRAPLPMGSYRLTLRLDGYADVLYPVLVGRGEAVFVPAPVRLLRESEIGDGWIYVPAGESILGGDPDARTEIPRHRARVPGFLTRRLEVTVRDYLDWLEALMDAGLPEAEVQARCPRVDSNREFLIVVRDDFLHRVDRFKLADAWPILGISWDDAQAYLEWRRRETGLPLRLPMEVEWERAARGADGRAFPWGDGFDWGWTRGGVGWEVELGGVRPRNVGKSVADHSPFEVHDMAGSVDEWCADEWPGNMRATRGGEWGGMVSEFFRVATRVGGRQVVPEIHRGFRLARDLPP